jgi:FAD:protein FMN transferase
MAQGFAADQVMKGLKENGVISAAIDTGERGLLRHDGAIAVQHPRGGALGTLKVSDGFLAVSGDYSARFTEDFMHHHIFDPANGFSPQELASVVTIAPTGTLADGLATAFMVMGIEASLDCLKRIEVGAALFVDKAGKVRLSPGMADRFQKI